jgi:Tfp pilus assembly protein PilF
VISRSIEPDLPFSYDQLGQLFFQAGSDADSERRFQEALQRDPNFLSAHLGLARVRQRQGKYADALLSAEAAEKLGRHTQAQATFQRYRELLVQHRAQRERQMDEPPNPEYWVCLRCNRGS